MTVTIEIPEKLAQAFAPDGADVSRALLEAMALEGYRRKLLGESQMRRLLDFEMRMEGGPWLPEETRRLPELWRRRSGARYPRVRPDHCAHGSAGAY